MSASVARLEAGLNLRLLERSTRRVRTTEAGDSLYQGASPLLERLREVALEVQERDDSISGTLRIAAPYEFGAHHLGAVSSKVMSLHPKLHIVLDVVHTSVDLFDRQYDIVFSMADNELRASSIVIARVFTFKRGVYASPKLLAQNDAVARAEDLMRLPLLAGSDDIEWTFTNPDGTLATILIKSPRLRSANAGVRKQATLEGIGVARITATYCEKEVRSGQLRQLVPDVTCAPLRVYALLPARRLMPAKVRAFLDALGEMAAVGS